MGYSYPMRFRRVRTPAGLQTQRLDGRWVPLADAPPLGPSPFSDEWELATAERHLRQGDALLPFTPLSFRDFLLSERHSVDAARGMVRRFHPASWRITSGYERITRATFPAFRPKKLFYRQPIYYMSNAMTIVPSGTPVAFPAYSKGLDFELEIGFALKAPLLNATPAAALAAVGAFVLLNDFSARDVQRAEDSQRRVGLLRAMNGKRSRCDQCTAPISDAAIEVKPFLVVFPKEPVNLGSAQLVRLDGIVDRLLRKLGHREQVGSRKITVT